ncbi:hypothetical protein IMSAG249_01712 [Lachnospiraceae bacterium]|nr:hypothetical protein [Lachnospiraceae bacterium]GFI69887.1 hypothetical protein IMSAG249_01712 [Lachnospiraceae bacterium]
MKIRENTTRYEDYKYVMQDAGNLYIGAKYSYEELLEQEMIPFKLKTILIRYVLTEASPETTLESQFYYLEENDFLYETYKQLKVRVKTQVQIEKKTLSGKTRMEYKEKIFTLQELVQMNLARKKASGMIVMEIIVSKLGMMVFSV